MTFYPPPPVNEKYSESKEKDEIIAFLKTQLIEKDALISSLIKKLE